MELGKKLAAGFVSDDAQVPADEGIGLAQDRADAETPGATSLPAPQPEPTAAG